MHSSAKSRAFPVRVSPAFLLDSHAQQSRASLTNVLVVLFYRAAEARLLFASKAHSVDCVSTACAMTVECASSCFLLLLLVLPCTSHGHILPRSPYSE